MSKHKHSLIVTSFGFVDFEWSNAGDRIVTHWVATGFMCSTCFQVFADDDVEKLRQEAQG